MSLEPDIKSSALPLPGQETTKNRGSAALSGQETTKNPQGNTKIFADSLRDQILLLVAVKPSRNNCLSLSIMQIKILLFCLTMVKSLAAANFLNLTYFSE